MIIILIPLKNKRNSHNQKFDNKDDTKKEILEIFEEDTLQVYLISRQSPDDNNDSFQAEYKEFENGGRSLVVAMKDFIQNIFEKFKIQTSNFR